MPLRSTTLRRIRAGTSALGSCASNASAPRTRTVAGVSSPPGSTEMGMSSMRSLNGDAPFGTTSTTSGGAFLASMTQVPRACATPPDKSAIASTVCNRICRPS